MESVFQSRSRDNIVPKKGDWDCPVRNVRQEACHLVEGAESRIGPAKMRSDRILICLSRLCRHTDVKGKRRGGRGGCGGVAAVIRLSCLIGKLKKERFISWLPRLNFCSTFFSCFTLKDTHFLKVNKKISRFVPGSDQEIPTDVPHQYSARSKLQKHR